jgi:Glycosyl hydrolase family 71
MRTPLAAVLLLAVCLVGCGSKNALPFPTEPAPTATGQTAASQTLASQIVNNTSASSNFVNQTNGNLGANNVSKLNVHSLLYAGATTKVLAQLLLWFGEPGHVNVGYNSTDRAQVQRQITDMISRGIDGVVVDWYGPNNSIDQATQVVMHEAEKHPGFSFSIMIDAGAIGSNLCSGCTPQQTLVQLLEYVEQNYFGSPAYLTVQGQPVVTEFNIDRSYAIDWNAARAALLATSPQFLFQDAEGFSHALSGGSYSWVMPEAGDYGLSYLASFYDTGVTFPNEKTMGAVYKGFNDQLAAWGSGRVMDQQCGQTWLQTFSQVNTLYSTSRQLPFLQLVTWNDYEEGTEIESGIDSCFGLQLSVTGHTLQWSIGGSESTVDHYTVYSSSDGQSLTRLTDIQVGVHSVDLCSLPVAAGNQKLLVQAVGKPSLANRMPGPVSYTPACSSSNP